MSWGLDQRRCSLLRVEVLSCDHQPSIGMQVIAPILQPIVNVLLMLAGIVVIRQMAGPAARQAVIVVRLVAQPSAVLLGIAVHTFRWAVGAYVRDAQEAMRGVVA